MTMKSVPLQVNSGLVEMNRIQSRAIMPHARPTRSPPMTTKAEGACPQTVSSQRAAEVSPSDACLFTLWMAKRVKRYIDVQDHWSPKRRIALWSEGWELAGFSEDLRSPTP